MGISDHLNCILRNLYAHQEATVRTRHGTMEWFQIRKGVHQGFILSLCLFNLYAEYVMQNAGLDKAQARIKTARRNISNIRYSDDTTLMAESEEIKSLLMKVKEESKKVGLKLDIQKTKIMASGPITSWQINQETVETVTDFILGGSKIIADGDCSHEIRQHIKKQRHYFANKGLSSQSYGFSSSHGWMWELDCNESWTLNWCLWTVVLEKTLESPLDCKEIQPGNQFEYSLEGLMLKLKLQYFGHLMWGTDSLEKTLMIWRQEEKGTTEDEMVGWHHWLDGHEFE